jgi:NADH-quinone oxidoreductase subunit N
MLEKIAAIWPEIVMLIAACACLATGLAPALGVRRMTPWVAMAGLVVALIIAMCDSRTGLTFAVFVKMIVALFGILLLFVAINVPERLRTTRLVESGQKAFDPGLAQRGEFYAFFLLSLVGVMLTAGASDLIWLFLALELTSLPTYVMVATSRDKRAAQEAAVKYFFLGAMAAAVFLYGFAMIYGASGYTDFGGIGSVLQQQVAAGGLSPLMTLGLALSLLGIAFKIAAFPMHFYTADVYQGATTPVTTFLAFVPKTAGFAAMILLLSLVPGKLPESIQWLLAIMAVLTMTIGNVMGLLQQNVKRVLAYSSVAHSGYMLVGLVAINGTTFARGSQAVLFYLIGYALASIASFGVIGSLKARGDEAETFDDLSGLAKRYPMMAGILLVSMLSLIGLPPMIGFLGKVYLLEMAWANDFGWLVIVVVLNSAISAVYYLRFIGAAYFSHANEQTQTVDAPWRRIAALLTAATVVIAGFFGQTIVDWTIAATPASVAASKAVKIADVPVLNEATKPAPQVAAPVVNADEQS